MHDVYDAHRRRSSCRLGHVDAKYDPNDMHSTYTNTHLHTHTHTHIICVHIVPAGPRRASADTRVAGAAAVWVAGTGAWVTTGVPVPDPIPELPSGTAGAAAEPRREDAVLADSARDSPATTANKGRGWYGCKAKSGEGGSVRLDCTGTVHG